MIVETLLRCVGIGRHQIWSLVLATTLVVTCGCSSASDSADGSLTTLQVLFPDAETDRQIFNELQASIVSCMHDRGFSYEPEIWVESQDVELIRDDTNGPHYAVPGSPPTSSPVQPNETILAALSPAEQRAWQSALNDTESGCGQEAEESFASKYNIDSHYEAMTNYSAALETDEVLDGLQAEWSDCMRRAGHAVWDRSDAIALVAAEAGGDPSSGADEGLTAPYDAATPSKFESEVASQDALCTDELNLDEALAERHQELIDEFFTE